MKIPEDIWTKKGKIDAIKFVKYMAEIKGTDEKEEMKEFLDWMGVKYVDKEE